MNFKKSIFEVDSRLSAKLVNRSNVDRLQDSAIDTVSQDVDTLEEDLDDQDAAFDRLKKNLTAVRSRVIDAGLFFFLCQKCVCNLLF